jgi:outer membrane protein TolC
MLHRLCAASLPLLGSLTHVALAAPPDTLPAEMIPTPPAEAQPAEVRQIPIGLDTVMRLAEEQNAQLARAHVKVEEAYAEYDLAAKRWYPEFYIGTNYYRHEGGIQDENGDFIRSSTGAVLNGLELHGVLDLREYAYHKVMAERKAWQHRGELSHLSYETLLDAGNTYIDLVTARHAEVVARSLLHDLKELLGKAEKLASKEVGARVEVARVRTEVLSREQLVRKLQAQGDAASAKLVYLLGMDPCVHLVPVDPVLTPIELVDVQPETCELVAQALTQGPGIRELEGMLGLIEDARRRAEGPSKYLPIFEARVLEGGFGAGPGSTMDWDNRMDAILQVRWNLSALCTAKERQRIADAQRAQVHLAYQDLRGKLTAGVHEARQAIYHGGEEIKYAAEQVIYAAEARNLSKSRLDNNVAGSSYGEVLLSTQALGLAHINKISSIRDYDKAQLRLLMLLGGGQPCAAPVLPPQGERLLPPATSEPVPQRP